MKYQNKDISELTIKELVDASFDLNHMEITRNKKLEHPKFKDKILKQHPPDAIANPNFDELKKAITAEIFRRTK